MKFKQVHSTFLVVSTILQAALIVGAITVFSAAAICEEAAEKERSVAEGRTEPVVIDGNILFQVRGITSFPPEKRAAYIAGQIEKVASNEAISTNSIQLTEKKDRVIIAAGGIHIMAVLDLDGESEGVDRVLLAEQLNKKIVGAIETWRHDRSRPVLTQTAIHAGAATGILTFVLIMLMVIMRRINRALQKRLSMTLQSVENKSFNLIRSAQIWRSLDLLFRLSKLMLVTGLLLAFVQYVIGIFPWTKGFAVSTLKMIRDPLAAAGAGIVDFLPDLAILVILFFVTRYLLRVLHLLFTGIKEKSITFGGFDPDWAMSTYRIVWVLTVILSVVVAYPYIPGSESDAFKGVSVFVGIVFSLGSSSVVGNLIAGYSLTYRNAFKVGDRIQVEGHVGYVEDQKSMVTRLRSMKNEEVVLPNSYLLNNNIINYTVAAKNRGLILHTTVGIGYETPWRQVDAMLKLAASRTEGLQLEPPPFVLKKALGDFAITYEINAFCTDATSIARIYSALHENILDVFNENNVQIMTPAYEGDPEIAKVVPKDQWYTPLVNAKP